MPAKKEPRRSDEEAAEEKPRKQGGGGCSRGAKEVAGGRPTKEPQRRGRRSGWRVTLRRREVTGQDEAGCKTAEQEPRRRRTARWRHLTRRRLMGWKRSLREREMRREREARVGRLDPYTGHCLAILLTPCRVGPLDVLGVVAHAQH